jgi:hypothetical protein
MTEILLKVVLNTIKNKARGLDTIYVINFASDLGKLCLGQVSIFLWVR